MIPRTENYLHFSANTSGHLSTSAMQKTNLLALLQCSYTKLSREKSARSSGCDSLQPCWLVVSLSHHITDTLRSPAYKLTPHWLLGLRWQPPALPSLCHRCRLPVYCLLILNTWVTLFFQSIIDQTSNFLIKIHLLKPRGVFLNPSSQV